MDSGEPGVISSLLHKTSWPNLHQPADSSGGRAINSLAGLWPPSLFHLSHWRCWRFLKHLGNFRSLNPTFRSALRHGQFATGERGETIYCSGAQLIWPHGPIAWHGAKVRAQGCVIWPSQLESGRGINCCSSHCHGSYRSSCGQLSGPASQTIQLHTPISTTPTLHTAQFPDLWWALQSKGHASMGCIVSMLIFYIGYSTVVSGKWS